MFMILDLKPSKSNSERRDGELSKKDSLIIENVNFFSYNY